MKRPLLRQLLPTRSTHPTRRAARPRHSDDRQLTPMQRRYARMVQHALAAHDIRVRRWRSSTTGCAWETRSPDGRVQRWIEAPLPRGPVSAAVFLHEVGHHAIGFHRYSPRCLEEHRAWVWALQAMERYELNVTEQVRKRMRDSLRYAVAKARRRGLKRLPAELAPYL